MNRVEKIRRAADEFRRRRASGEEFSEEQFLARHRELSPELDGELKKLAVIEQAREHAFNSPSVEGAESFASEADPLLDPSVPPKVPDYDMVRLIGWGGFGQVWLARNQHDGQFYAVKTVPSSCGVELDGVREYKKRAEANPFLVPIGHVGRAGDIYYYTMPLADDAKGIAALRAPEDYEPMTLERHLAHHGRLSVDEAIPIARQILRGLEALHQAGGVHRDVKPANVLKIHGAWRLGDQGLMSSSQDLRSRVGTHGFWPPEGALDSTADLYALGKTLYLLLTGAELRSFPEFAAGTLPLPQDRRAGPFRDLILRACHDDRAGRIATAAEMQRDLDRIARRGERPTRLWWVAGTVATLLGLLVAGLLVTRPWQPTREIVRILEVEVRHHRGDPTRYLGNLGSTSFAAQWNDDVQVLAELDAPGHCYLIAFNPDGTAELCYPDDASVEPVRVERLRYPLDSLSFYPLTEGVGLQAFALIASTEPLPTYEKWRSRAGEPPWRPTQHDGVWRFDGTQFIPLWSEERGPVRTRSGPPRVLRDLAAFFQGRPEVDAVQLLAFPVKPGLND